VNADNQARNRQHDTKHLHRILRRTRNPDGSPLHSKGKHAVALNGHQRQIASRVRAVSILAQLKRMSGSWTGVAGTIYFPNALRWKKFFADQSRSCSPRLGGTRVSPGVNEEKSPQTKRNRRLLKNLAGAQVCSTQVD
jgi:hypothetical protein